MARDFNQNRNTNAKLGQKNITTYGKTYAVQYGLDGFSVVNNVVQPMPTDIKEYLEGNDNITIFACASNIDKLCEYALMSFPNIEDLYLFKTSAIVVLEDDLSYLLGLNKIYVPSDLLSAYISAYPTLSSKFDSIVEDYTLTIPFIGDTTLTSEYVDRVIAMLSNAEKNAITKVVIPTNFTFDSVLSVLKVYDFSEVTNLNGNIWYGNTSTKATSFISDSWLTIKFAIELNDIFPYSLGDTKSINYDNNTYTIRICDIGARYDLSSDSGKNKATFEFVEILIGNGQINGTGTNNGGFALSNMKNVLLPNIYNNLPSDLKAIISQVKISSASDGSANGEGSLSYSDNYLFLPNNYEIFGSRGFSNSIEQTTQYDLYQENNISSFKIKYYSGVATFWWLRSPRAGTPQFCGVGTNGQASGNGANDRYGVVPFFCI